MFAIWKRLLEKNKVNYICCRIRGLSIRMWACASIYKSLNIKLPVIKKWTALLTFLPSNLQNCVYLCRNLLKHTKFCPLSMLRLTSADLLYSASVHSCSACLKMPLFRHVSKLIAKKDLLLEIVSTQMIESKVLNICFFTLKDAALKYEALFWKLKRCLSIFSFN